MHLEDISMMSHFYHLMREPVLHTCSWMDVFSPYWRTEGVPVLCWKLSQREPCEPDHTCDSQSSVVQLGKLRDSFILLLSLVLSSTLESTD